MGSPPPDVDQSAVLYAASLAAKMYNTLAKLTFSVGGKNYVGVKKLQGAPKTYKRRKKPIRKTKKSGDLFFCCFLE